MRASWPFLILVSCGRTAPVFPLPAPMPISDSFLSAATGVDCRIYVVHNRLADVGGSARVDAYEPNANRWSDVPPLPSQPNAPHGFAVSIGDQVFAQGEGSSIFAYDVSAGAWSARAPTRHVHIAPSATAGDDGRLYVVGGADGQSGPALDHLTSCEAYSPLTDAWEDVAALPFPSTLDAATTSGSHIFEVGFAGVGVFEPQVNQWARGPSLQPARFFMGAATGLDGTVYAMGGQEELGPTLSRVEGLAPGAAGWKDLAPLPVVAEGFAAATGCDGRIYVFGGSQADGGTLNTVQVFDPTSDSWAVSVH